MGSIIYTYIMHRVGFKVLNKFSTNIKSFQSLESLNEYLSFAKRSNTVVYFRASWNPNCQQSDQDAETLAANHPHLDIIKVDTDVSPKIAKHYSVKAEPEFVFCLYGDQVIRQTGANYEGLEEKNEKVNELAKNTDMSSIDDKWMPYGTAYKVYYEQMIKQTYKADFRGI